MDEKEKTWVSTRLLAEYREAEEDVKEAMDAAKAAYKDWSNGYATPDEVAAAFEKLSDKTSFLRYVSDEITKQATTNIEKK